MGCRALREGALLFSFELRFLLLTVGVNPEHLAYCSMVQRTATMESTPQTNKTPAAHEDAEFATDVPQVLCKEVDCALRRLVQLRMD